MEALYEDGPLVVGIDVYDDFTVYPTQGQVYTRRETMVVEGTTYDVELQGGHAVQIVGWDVVDSKKVWKIKNQWGAGWGNAGYGYVLRGANTVGIESNVLGILPDLSRSPLVPTTAAPAVPSAGSSAPGKSADAGRSRRRRTVVLLCVSAALILVAALGYSVRRRHTRRTPNSA